ncbi:hypothetical protein MMP66_16210 [Acinetobacter dispersus]|uniref:Uncharacterized protein n=1 Tax=Acinetobacter dispersus TaxID=70348 RepID=N9SH63_9GAMM|nr:MULTISPECIES: hypothetical protein [Acinetobacter]ENW94414.1 hypothetical protein F904_01340 [Acinetobacter dispersus]ENX53901.1 hypothetical protein F901_01178 [Acinetobacter dispersus]MCH7385288.1 hypothetical protein [Acinetobacter dispersus]MCH7392134.1 hypothetical protein [Acinetobacter dispersus]MCH7395798.1 hypothetical protein [Acinetobacter dispersus]
MNEFELKIRYPHQMNHNDIDHVGTFDLATILTKFDEMAWRQQLVRQLQLNGADTSFIVSDHRTEQTISITLDAYAKSQQLEFKLDSDIPVIIPKKDLFGLVTRKSKDSISFKQLSLARVKDYLIAFLNRDIESLEERYKEKLSKALKTPS